MIRVLTSYCFERHASGPVSFLQASACGPFPLQSIKRLFEQLAQGNAPLIGHLVEPFNRRICSLEVELPIAARRINAAFPARLFYRLRRLPTWKVILFGDARDGLFLDGCFFSRFCREDRRVVCQVRERIDASIHAAPAMSVVSSSSFFLPPRSAVSRSRTSCANSSTLSRALSRLGTSAAFNPSSVC